MGQDSSRHRNHMLHGAEPAMGIHPCLAVHTRSVVRVLQPMGQIRVSGAGLATDLESRINRYFHLWLVVYHFRDILSPGAWA